LKNNSLLDSSIKLSGAGGGLAAAFQIMFNSQVISSQVFILNHLGLRRYIDESNYILTGEGVFDIQTFMGKGAGVLVRQALAKNKEVFLVCGSYLIMENFIENFKVFELQEFFNSKEESIAKFEEGIDKVCKKIALSLK
jgi:glycerate 2-kinase